MSRTVPDSLRDGLLPDGYPQPATEYDELRDADGGVRPHWQTFIDAVGGLDRDDLERRRRQADRFLRENGVTFNLHGEDPEGERPWEFDPVPFLLDEADWQRIESGLLQRARLLDAVLADLYGPRTLLDEGVLPADLVYGHEGFLLPCDGIRLPGERQLVLYGADLARGPDGRMWIVGDRTQVPFGMGYALENRTAATRLFPSTLRDCRVRRLATFFRDLHAHLGGLQERAGARVVVLTPGPTHPTYFEHAYLAAYLGYSLVQGSDLTVRAGGVWLKSIDGLERVDVILRRVDDSLCDPLELDGDSVYGVPGLLEAARRGEVAITNPVGSGVLENPGLLPFLPAAAEHLLGEDLELPSMATWWCGQAGARQYVLEHLSSLRVLPTGGGDGIDGDEPADGGDEAALREAILAAPHRYVGQEPVSASSSPAFVDGNLEARPAILRAFVVASPHGAGYTVMPGGLTRSAPRPQAGFSALGDGSTKDTWVLSSQPEPHVSMWQRRAGDADVLPQPSLPSRSAENLFWVGRYAERAEATTRLLRTLIDALTADRETPDDEGSQHLPHLLASLTRLTATAPGFLGFEARRDDPRPELLAVATAVERPGSLAFTLQSLVRAAFAVRDRWSGDTWRVIDDLHEVVWRLGRPEAAHLRRVHDELDQLITPLAAFAGLNKESMTREAGWLLLDTGRRIERALLLISLVRSCLVPRLEEEDVLLLLEAVLVTEESLITYRRRYRSYPEPGRVVDLLLLDHQNPRGLAFQLQQLSDHLARLPGERSASGLTSAEGPVLEAHTRLRLVRVDHLLNATGGPVAGGRHDRLEQLLDGLEGRLQAAAQAIEEHYFQHVADSRQLVPIRPQP